MPDMMTYFRIIEQSRSSSELRQTKRFQGWNTHERIIENGDTKVFWKNQEIILVNQNGDDLWPSPVPFPNVPMDIHSSGDRLLVLTGTLEYHAWGFLGPAILMRKDDGSTIAELKGERGANYGEGCFILGLEGYDTFDTWLHDRDGSLLQQWRSYGHYAVDQDGSVRVLECDRRMPTESRVVRLMRDGSIKRGSRLVECQISPPVILDDGTLVFIDHGVLRSVDRSLREETIVDLLKIPADDERTYDAELVLTDHTLSVEISEKIDSTTNLYHRWLIELQTENLN